MKKIIVFTGLVLLLFSCKKDTKIESKGPSVFQFTFKPTVNNEPLVPETKWYKNFSGDSFTVTKFNYYVSNIRFKRNDGTYYNVPECYHLIRHVEGVNSFTISGIPEGDYNRMEFLIGVDSIRNVSGSQSGDLDPGLNMFWDWNTGYIFYKLEGQFNTLTQPVKTGYAMHVGGYSGKENCIQKWGTDYSGLFKSRSGHTTKVFLQARVDEVFQNPKNIDFDYYYNNISNAMLKELSDNYSDMFFLESVEN